MNKMLLPTLLIVLTACGPQASPETTTQENDPATALTAAVKDSLTNELNAIAASGPIHGFGVTMANVDGVLYAEGFGYADVATQKPYTAHTIQNIGSVSKTLIGIALLKAQELGKLQLDDPVNDYLPFKVVNPFYPETPITIRQLSTHTSTILDTDFYNEKSYMIYRDEDLQQFDLKAMGETFNPQSQRLSMGDFLKNLLAQDGAWYSDTNYLNREPGTLFEYSNVGATLAAYVIEKACGTSYDDFTSTYILEPLEMTDSGWSLDRVDLSQHSTLYGKPKTALPHYYLITYPDGGVLTSAKDLGKYLSELIRGQAGQGKLLEPESYQELFAGQLTEAHLPDRDEESVYNDEYDIGVFMGISAKGYYGHTGGDPGIASYMFFNPATHTGKYMMINTSIVSQEGVDQFFSIWNTLERYEARIKQ